MRYGFTYGDENFKNSRELAKKSLEKYCDFSYLYTEKDLIPYVDKYNSILSQKRGSGYWLFKSIFLKEMFKIMDYGDELIYIDSGIEVIDDIDIFFDISKLNNGFCLFQHPHLNYKWIKRDCFVLMDCDSEYYYNSNQCDASIQCYIKNELTEKFINEYFSLCSDDRLLTDKDNTQNKPNLDGFIDHRHDQSILTLLCLKNKINRFKQPTQYYKDWGFENLNNFEIEQSKKYEIKFNHHRTRI
jgi:hypothetical protein